MKLRNKRTGEIIDLSKGSITDVGLGSKIQLQATDRYNKPIWAYDSLAELNANWEDAPKEPKEYWYIDADGEPLCEPSDDRCEFDNNCKEIGNYFSSSEEADLAVRKLKAWKRLKDNGFRFNGWSGTQVGSNISYIRENYYDGGTDDMDLLFSEVKNEHDNIVE